ncbi:MAG: glycosyltransferase family 2 protein, partial [Proteobacteria bacterium]|nr:glycosyltransferase family 2 protein [Pseudomonadota bacterium]
MKVVALLAVRNEALYLDRCLRRLRDQGIDVCLIDNQSTDDTLEIAESYYGRGVFRIENHPYPGFYDWVSLLKFKERLAQEIDADWFVHHDADEIIEAPAGFANLRHAIVAVANSDCNAINCDEFVFLPTDERQHYEHQDYVAEMRHYYFFEPTPVRLVRMWRRHPDILLHDSGGHGASFAGRKIFPTPFILRHYIGLSADYLRAKYAGRVYSENEVRERGWH